MSTATADLVSLEDTPLATTQSHESNSLLDDIQPEQKPTTPALPVLTSEKTALRVKTNQFRKSVDFHPSVSGSSSPVMSPRHAKRSSMSFPVNVTPSYYPSTHYSQLRSPIQHTPTASETAVISDQVEPASDPLGFLTVLAGQERRVLELKEELIRADAQLEKLKRKWALHEATRKRSESATVEQIRNLELAGETKNHARRKSIGAVMKPGRRTTTFNGNTKHQRTLSLLSPNGQQAHSFPQPADVDEPLKPSIPRRANTVKETSSNSMLYESGYEKSIYEPRSGKRIGHQEALIATGKQMAEDFKEGLWTFIEDLRQATVGEEVPGSGSGVQKPKESSIPTAAAALKKKNSKANLKITPVSASSIATKSKIPRKTKTGPKATKLVDIGDDFWSEMDPDGPLSSKSKEVEEIDYFKHPALPITYKKGHVKPESVRWSSSTIVSEMGSEIMSPGAYSYSSPRTSTSSRSRSSSPNRKYISEPFPEKSPAELIQSLADTQQATWGMISAPLGNLKRTATAVLTQIEKGLGPPPATHSSYYDLENARHTVSVDHSKAKKQH
ncbi:hypothetical protein TWF730_009381 [Orbilia blumenaviensis]|uniref:DUF4048 domain-containing protein n=1 Tax=Orbilia blumenaviensis TaxID=1796055 RepID=A0AAV9V1F9_9PEZI